jgi:hypothetical protein
MATSGGFQQSVYVLTTEPANIAAITVAELGAGTQIDDGIPEPVSFSGTTNQMDTSVLRRQDRSEPGTVTMAEITIEAFRNAAGDLVVAAFTADADHWLVKFEGGNIAAGDHGAVAIGDTYDAVRVVAGTRSDVDTPRPDPRRHSIPLTIADSIQWDGTVA